uniref:Uncharacterized protein n=1 Tax=Lepeophtheirus salmonis TaxID=72036 RepID=A0A0K2SXG2_LEPSM
MVNFHLLLAAGVILMKLNFVIIKVILLNLLLTYRTNHQHSVKMRFSAFCYTFMIINNFLNSYLQQQFTLKST